MAKNPLTDAEKEQIRDAADAAWNEIAHDVFEGMRTSRKLLGPKPPTGWYPSMPRSQVVEVVLDCDRLVERLPKELAAKVRAMEHRHVRQIVTEAFPDKRYSE